MSDDKPPRPDMVRVMDHKGEFLWARKAGLSRAPLPRPFLQWMGGKARNSKHILAAVPTTFRDYYEPFLGGGAIYYALHRAGLLGGCHCKTRRQRRTCECRKVHLNDANADLMTAWEAVRDDASGVVQWLSERTGYRDEYLGVRAWDRDAGFRSRSVTERGARMIYLTKLAFGGSYRVNGAGQAHPAYGGMCFQYKGKESYTRTYCDSPAIHAASASLAGVNLSFGDFTRVTYTAGENDLVFLDPPYCEPTGNHHGQESYRCGGFTAHARVADTFRRLATRGCHVIACNHDTPQVRELYRGFRIESYGVHRKMTSNAAKRRKVSEVIITNT